MLLFGTGLAGLAGLRRKKMKKPEYFIFGRYLNGRACCPAVFICLPVYFCYSAPVLISPVQFFKSELDNSSLMWATATLFP
jgi:hypothetical protein